MEYKGRYDIFNNSDMRTYPVNSRKSKLSHKNFFKPQALAREKLIHPDDNIEAISKSIINAYNSGKPVIVFTGAHSIKNGISPLYIDLMKRGIITHFATNVAGTIHDFETAIQGQTSEDVRGALDCGDFGMAFETGRILNAAYIEGNNRKLGYGESLGLLYNDADFRHTVLSNAFSKLDSISQYIVPENGFNFIDYSVMAAAYLHKVPATIHASIGTDIIDQHTNFDAAAKGACSGRDFLIYTQAITKLTCGGVILNIGSAVTGPEVLLKAVSMAANTGHKPDSIVCADFDIRPFVFDDETRDESKYYYYLRDQKSCATRIPKVFNGRGYYIEGDHSSTVATLYQYIVKKLK